MHLGLKSRREPAEILEKISCSCMHKEAPLLYAIDNCLKHCLARRLPPALR